MGKIFYLVPKVKGRRGSMALLPPPHRSATRGGSRILRRRGH